MIKNIYKKFMDNPRLNGDKINAFSLKTGKKVMMSPSLLPFNIVLEVLANAVR